MKISIEKIAHYPVKIDTYLSNDIFSFRLDAPDLYEQRLKTFKSKLQDNSKLSPQMESLVKANLAHIFRADQYFTNGQMLASLLKTEQGYEISFRRRLETFAAYFSTNPPYKDFLPKKSNLKKYQTYEKAELEILKVLSRIVVIRIPVKRDEQIDYLTIQRVYPSTYHFRHNKQIFVRQTDYYGDWIDKVTQQIIEALYPNEVQCCLSCKHFKFSGMSYDSSGGRTGYCFRVKDQLAEVTVGEATTDIWSWCSGFEQK